MSAADSTTPGGVIHDIGFRHYNGPRLGRRWAFRALLIETVRGAYGLGRPTKARIMPWLLLAFFLAPALVVVTVAVISGDERLAITYTQYPIAMSALITFFVAGRAPYAVSRDLRNGVVPLYLSRPIARNDYVAAKFVGVWIATFLFIAAPMTLIMVGALLLKFSVAHTVWGWLGGLLMAALLSALLTAISLTIAAFTKRRGLGVAAILAVLVLATGLATVVVSAAGHQVSHEAGSFGALLDPYLLIDGLGHALLGVDPQHGGVTPDSALATTVFIVAFLGITSGALAILFARFKKVGGV